MTTQNTIEQLLDNLRFLNKELLNKKDLIQSLQKKNASLYNKITDFDLDLFQLEQELQRKSSQITTNKTASIMDSFFSFIDTPTEGITNLSVGSRNSGALTSVKVLSTSEITSLDDTPVDYKNRDSIVLVSSSDISFQELYNWKSFNMTTLDLSAVTGSGTRVDLAGSDLDNKFYLIHMGEDTSVRINIVLGTTFHGRRCGFHVYAGEADTSDPSVKFIRSTAAISIPDWNFASAYHYLNLDNSLVLKYDSSLGAFITENEYTRT